jgi:hypothetical protein
VYQIRKFLVIPLVKEAIEFIKALLQGNGTKIKRSGVGQILGQVVKNAMGGWLADGHHFYWGGWGNWNRR